MWALGEDNPRPAAASPFERKGKIIPLTVGGFNKISELKLPPRTEQAMVWATATCKREVIFHCSGNRGAKAFREPGTELFQGLLVLSAESLGPL